MKSVASVLCSGRGDAVDSSQFDCWHPFPIIILLTSSYHILFIDLYIHQNVLYTPVSDLRVPGLATNSWMSLSDRSSFQDKGLHLLLSGELYLF